MRLIEGLKIEGGATAVPDLISPGKGEYGKGKGGKGKGSAPMKGGGRTGAFRYAPY